MLHGGNFYITFIYVLMFITVPVKTTNFKAYPLGLVSILSVYNSREDYS